MMTAEHRLRDAERAEQTIEHLYTLPLAERRKLRRQRAEQERERLAILLEISRLEPFLCEDCGDRDLEKISRTNYYQCGCPAAVEIRKLGERLQTLINPEKLKKPEDPFLALSVENGISVDTYRTRIHSLKWDPEKAATTPVKTQLWTAEEESILRQACLDGKSYKEITKLLPNRGYPAIRDRGRHIRKQLKAEGLL